MVVHSEEGAVDYFLNTGSTAAGGGSSGLGGIGAGVRLADLDGDGQDDYVAVGPESEAIGYLNGGQYSDNIWLWNIVRSSPLTLRLLLKLIFAA